MKVYLPVLNCAECGWAMWYEFRRSDRPPVWVECCNADCGQCRKRYGVPEINLTPIDEATIGE